MPHSVLSSSCAASSHAKPRGRCGPRCRGRRRSGRCGRASCPAGTAVGGSSGPVLHSSCRGRITVAVGPGPSPDRAATEGAKTRAKTADRPGAGHCSPRRGARHRGCRQRAERKQHADGPGLSRRGHGRPRHHRHHRHERRCRSDHVSAQHRQPSGNDAGHADRHLRRFRRQHGDRRCEALSAPTM